MHFFWDIIQILADFWRFNCGKYLRYLMYFSITFFIGSRNRKVKIGDRPEFGIATSWNTPAKYFSWSSYFCYVVMQKQTNETRSIPCNVCVDLECTRQSHLHYQMPQWNQPNQSLSPNMFVQFSSSLFPKLSNKYQKENSFPRLAACSITAQWRTL